MPRLKLPSHVEVLAEAELVPYTKHVTQEVVESLDLLFAESHCKGIKPKQLLLHYRYAVDSALIKYLMKKYKGNQSRVYPVLGISHEALGDMCNRLGIFPKDFK